MNTPTPEALREFEIPGGIKVTVPANPRLMTTFILEERGDWFEDEIRFVRSALRPGMAVVDIGANYGLYTLSCAQRVGPQGRVWAYEPASLPRGCLARSLVANGLPQVRLHGAALSDHCGNARLGIAANAELNRLDAASVQYETVPLTTLDAETAAWDRPVDFVKIDAEGEEVRILAGARGFLDRDDPLLMLEYCLGGEENRPLLAAIGQLGMAIYRYLPALDALVPLDLAPSRPNLLNLFACRPARAARLRDAGSLVAAPAPVPADLPPRLATWFRDRAWSRAFAPELSDRTSPALAAALDDALNGEDAALPAAVRLALKQRAFGALKPLTDQHPSLPRLLSASRLAMDLAEQELSVSYLLAAARLIADPVADPARAIDEPFLPPDRQHDSLGAAGTAQQTLSIMVDEALLDRSTYSVFYAGRKVMPELLRIARNPLRSPASERRLAAARRLLPV